MYTDMDYETTNDLIWQNNVFEGTWCTYASGICSNTDLYKRMLPISPKTII